jgi:4-phytase/acid phosphatase
MSLLGAYDRDYFVAAGLFESLDCKTAAMVRIHADIDQRTVESARSFAGGLLPGCNAAIDVLSGSKADPLFSPIKAGLGKLDHERAAAAVLGRIGGHADRMTEGYQPALQAMQAILRGCEPTANCVPQGPVTKSVFDIASSVQNGKGDQLAEIAGPLSTGSTLSEDLLLEYADGMESGKLGWGRLNLENLTQLLAIHTAYADLARRTFYLAQANSSNLMSHMLGALNQAVDGTSDRLYVLMGHDTNISNVSGLLNLSWSIPGYPRDDTPPGGALVFELWCAPQSHDCDVRTYYISQTPEQMRNGSKLTLASPPPRAAVFVPDCSSSAEGFECSWDSFRHAVESRIDPAFVR